jgi:hypothetical protein
MDINEILGQNPISQEVQSEAQVKRFGDDTKAGPQINKYFDEINISLNVSYTLKFSCFILQDLQERINTVISGNQNEFFIAFRRKMEQIMKDMQDLKDKANAENIKAKQEEKLVVLEKERDWFRAEALKLNKLQKEQKIILDRMKEQLQNAQEDRDYYQLQLHEEKMNSKALTIENLKFKNAKIAPENDILSVGGLKQSQESVARIQKEL